MRGEPLGSGVGGEGATDAPSPPNLSLGVR